MSSSPAVDTPAVRPARPPLNAWRRRFIGRVLGVSVLFQVPAVVCMALVLTRWTRVPAGWAWAVAVTAHLAHLTLLSRRLVFWLDDRRAPVLRTWLLDVPAAGYASTLLVAAVPAWCALAAGGVFRAAGLSPGVHVPSVTAMLAGVYGLALVMGAWGTTGGRMLPRVVHRDVPVAGLSPAMDGYRIVQLSDIHHGPYLPRWLYRHWAATAVAQKPDLVAVTGDFITSGEGYLDDVTDLFTHLAAPDGVVACLGNHDYFNATTGVADAITRGGGTVLRNTGVTVTRGPGALWVAGVDDRWSRRDDLDAALRDRPAGVPTVLLAHDPAQFPMIAARGVELTLSGHTHGGQYAVPFVPRANLARVSTRYTVGMFHQGRSVLYVHRGDGTSGPPTRVGAAPEVAVLVLRAV